jgi:hypothetical protein
MYSLRVWVRCISCNKSMDLYCYQLQSSYAPPPCINPSPGSRCAWTTPPPQWLGRFLGISGWDPSVCQCNWLHVDIRERHWVPIPVPAGMGRVRVHLKLNGWVRMDAHIYYTMASRAPGPPHSLNEVRTRIRNSGSRCFYDRTMTWNKVMRFPISTTVHKLLGG